MIDTKTKTKIQMESALKELIDDKYRCAKSACISTNDMKVCNIIINMFKDQCIGAVQLLWRTNYIYIDELGIYENIINTKFSDLYE